MPSYLIRSLIYVYIFLILLISGNFPSISCLPNILYSRPAFLERNLFCLNLFLFPVLKGSPYSCANLAIVMSSGNWLDVYINYCLTKLLSKDWILGLDVTKPWVFVWQLRAELVKVDVVEAVFGVVFDVMVGEPMGLPPTTVLPYPLDEEI